jgi:hypothetical protein
MKSACRAFRGLWSTSAALCDVLLQVPELVGVGLDVPDGSEFGMRTSGRPVPIWWLNRRSLRHEIRYVNKGRFSGAVQFPA